jgi:hypothetical protein
LQWDSVPPQHSLYVQRGLRVERLSCVLRSYIVLMMHSRHMPAHTWASARIEPSQIYTYRLVHNPLIIGMQNRHTQPLLIRQELQPLTRQSAAKRGCSTPVHLVLLSSRCCTLCSPRSCSSRRLPDRPDAARLVRNLPSRGASRCGRRMHRAGAGMPRKEPRSAKLMQLRRRRTCGCCGAGHCPQSYRRSSPSCPAAETQQPVTAGPDHPRLRGSCAGTS